jgi:hypothetical protein
VFVDKTEKEIRKNQWFKSCFDYIGNDSPETIVSKHHGVTAFPKTGSTPPALHLLSSI